jgi:hypothetical protein
MKMAPCAVVIVLVLAAAACGDSSPSSPSTPPNAQVSGHWTGSATDTSSGKTGSITFDLTQSGTSVAGTWSATSDTNSNGGTLTGSINQSSFASMWTSATPGNCPFQATATIESPTQMSGNYTAINCANPGGGKFTASLR